MGKLKEKIVKALKSDKTKRIENNVNFGLKKAQELYETNYDLGYRYFSVASRNYDKLSGKDEVLDMRFKSIGYAYANRGEPIL